LLKKASFFKQFKLGGLNLDFNETKVSLNSNIILRKKSGISIDECARLCVQEYGFECQTFTYGTGFRECKWSPIENSEASKYLIETEDYSFFSSKI
jgi:hypothetical protein